MIECNSCGKCCIKYSNAGLSATIEELAYWEDNRPEIFRYVKNGKIWMDPDTGEQLESCPWLRKTPDQSKYTCDIYHDRPEDCRLYPSTIEEMAIDSCEMLESKDRMSKTQAKHDLEIIMAENHFKR